MNGHSVVESDLVRERRETTRGCSEEGAVLSLTALRIEQLALTDNAAATAAAMEMSLDVPGGVERGVL